MRRYLAEEEIIAINNKSRNLFENYDPTKYTTLEEKIKACNAITLEEFREMGIQRIKEIYGMNNGAETID